VRISTLSPASSSSLSANQIEGYNLPLGPLTHLYRDTFAAGKAGPPSPRVGLGTLRRSAPSAAASSTRKTTEDLIELMTVGGQGIPVLQGGPDQCRHHSRYHRRSGRANITMEREGSDDRIAVARDGGAQLGRAGDRAGRTHRRGADAQTRGKVKIPGAIVDCIVVTTKPESHMQTYGTCIQPGVSRLRCACR